MGTQRERSASAGQAGRSRGGNCEHGMRRLHCPTCIQIDVDGMDWDRAVAERREAARLLGYDRPCEETAYLDLLAELEPTKEVHRA